MIILTKRLYVERDIVVRAIFSLYGEFKNNFIQVYGKSSSEVRDEIDSQICALGHPEINIDIYVYISSFNDDDNATVIIRKAVR